MWCCWCGVPFITLTGISLMGLAGVGFLGLCFSKGSTGRVLLRLYSLVLIILMIAFFAAGGAIIYAAQYLVRGVCVSR